jgi:hypothetical protein
MFRRRIPGAGAVFGGREYGRRGLATNGHKYTQIGRIIRFAEEIEIAMGIVYSDAGYRVSGAGAASGGNNRTRTQSRRDGTMFRYPVPGIRSREPDFSITITITITTTKSAAGGGPGSRHPKPGTRHRIHPYFSVDAGTGVGLFRKERVVHDRAGSFF